MEHAEGPGRPSTPPKPDARLLRDQDVPRKPPINIEIIGMTNGWMICTATADQGQLGGTPRGRPILIEKVRGRDNIAHLLAQVAVLLGDDGE